MISALACFSGTGASLRWLVPRNHNLFGTLAMFVFDRSFWTVAAGLGTALAFVALSLLLA
jgi:hypothetical protein